LLFYLIFGGGIGAAFTSSWSMAAVKMQNIMDGC
jgi:hypothetical protein